MSAARTSEAPAPVTYQFADGASTGVWLGFGVARVALVGVGLLIGVLLLTAGFAALGAALPVLICGGIAAARVAGRPLLEWVAPFMGHRAAAVTGDGRWSAPFPTAPNGSGLAGGVRLALPREFGRQRLTDCPDDPSVGLVVDTAARTVTVVFEVAGVDRFPLLETEDRDTLIAGWGQALAVLADTDDALRRLQVTERAAHEPPAPLTGVTDASDSDAARDYASLCREVDAFATAHVSTLAVQWAFPRIDDSTLATVAGRCRGVSRCLLSARLLTRPLSATEIARDLATGLRGPQPARGPVVVTGPVSRRVFWSHIVTDETWHRSYAISGWPATQVTADWLAPLVICAPDNVTRTVALHLERVTPAAAARTARATRAKAALDQRDRVRLGMTTSAVIDRAESSGVAMDEELAAGYRTHRLTGLVTLSGDSTDALDDAARVLRQAAAAAHLELRPLNGQHDVGLAATLPLCRVRPGGQS